MKVKKIIKGISLLSLIHLINFHDLSAQKIACGTNHSHVICSDGTSQSWGENGGALGDSSVFESHVPVQVYGLSGAKSVSGGYYHSLYVLNDGTVWATGFNNYGQLGNGFVGGGKIIPVQITALSGITSVAAGNWHSLALKNDGTVWAWGRNDMGQLGDGTIAEKHVPVQVNGLSDIVDIAAGADHSLALKSDGSVWSWGHNVVGQLGEGFTNGYENIPVQVITFTGALSGIIAVAAGSNHSLALKNDSTVWAWGYNTSGQVGDSSPLSRWNPVQVIGLSGITAISGGGNHSLALMNNGTVWGWGYNGSGQLGDGTTITRLTAVQLSGFFGVVAIAGGEDHSHAEKNDGTVWAWGANDNGQLGLGDTSPRNIPIQVNGVCSVSIGIGEIMERNFVSIYPNPVSNNLTIEISSASSEKKELSIYNTLGQEVVKKSFLEGKCFVDVSSFQTGVYFVEVRAEIGAVRRKVVKM